MVHPKADIKVPAQTLQPLAALSFRTGSKDQCPSECIAMADEKAVVDADGCVDCGVCIDACPVEAIVLE